jgi:condensin complex subunit 3
VLSRAADPTARWRACQLVACAMGALPAEEALADAAADAVEAAMLERLADARPAVRGAAARALARLPAPDDGGGFAGCTVTAALLELLASERSKEVRKAVLASLPAAAATLPALLDRTRDAADDVRRVTYLALAEKVPLDALAPGAAALLARRGLGDRAPAVAAAAGALVAAWLDGGAGGDPLALLRRLDAERHPAEAEAALKALLASGRLDAAALAALAAEESLGLRQDFSPAGGAAPLGPEEALFWRVVCEALAARAAARGLAAAGAAGAVATIEAAAAGEALEALEAALPPSVEETVAAVAAHAAAGPAHRFAAGQLMAAAAAACDFTDASGRRAAAALLEDVLSSEDDGAAGGAGDDAWRAAVALLLRRVHAAPAELAEALLGVAGRLHARDGLAGGDAPEGAWLRALRALSLLLEALPSARPALAVEGGFSLADAVALVVLPGAEHAAPRVRAEAARCLGLYCLLEGTPTPLAGHVAALRALLASPAEPLAVRAMAARALGDVALQRGARGADALAAQAAVFDAAEGEDGTRAPPAAPLVDLLLSVLASWQEAFAEVGAAGHGAGAPAPAEVEAAAELGTAVVEALARLVAVNELRAAGGGAGEAALEDGDVLRLLVALLLAQFEPATEPAERLRQCLAVFFGRYAALGAAPQQFLATALLPAARAAAAEDAAAGARGAAARAPALLRYAAALLQTEVPAPAGGGARESVGHEQLAELVVGEVLLCARRAGAPRAHVAALVKLALALPLCPAPADDGRETMLRVAVCAHAAAGAVADRAAAKDLEAVAARFATAAGAEVPELPPEALAALLEGVRSHVDAFCEGYQLPFGEEGEARAAPARRAAGGAAAAAPARRLPARAARAAKAVVDADTDEESPEKRRPTFVPPPPPESSGEEEEEESDAEEAGEEEEEAGSGEEEEEEEAEAAQENAMASPAAAKRATRRKSAASTAALRDALREAQLSASPLRSPAL